MGKDSAIGWTDHTFNPWWGCIRVSPGCEHCYAEAFAKRTGHDVWGPGERRLFGEKHWNEPRRWNAKAAERGVRERVFCASMADVFEDHPQLIGERERLWDLIAETPALDWLLLTKRIGNVSRMVPWDGHGYPPNVWLGVTIECGDFSWRALELAELPAAVRFLSCEPLVNDLCVLDLTGIDWVICGGESGPKHRPMNLDHARALRDQCQAEGVPFFFKQVGGRTPKAGGDLLDGREWKSSPQPTEVT